MEVWLKSLAANSASKEIKLPAARFLIGRDEDCHLRPKSDLVSRHHCIVFVEPDGVLVRDLGSRNGTFVNDERLAGERPLASGDRLCVGPLAFEVRITASSSAPAQQTRATPAAARSATASVVTPGAVPAAAPSTVLPAASAASAGDSLEAYYLQALGLSDDRPTRAGTSDASSTVPPKNQVATTEREAAAHEAETIDLSSSGTQVLGASTKLSASFAESAPAEGHRVLEPAIDGELPSNLPTNVPAPKGLAGKLPTIPRTSSKDSRSAAADTLRRFFYRR